MGRSGDGFGCRLTRICRARPLSFDCAPDMTGTCYRLGSDLLLNHGIDRCGDLFLRVEAVLDRLLRPSVLDHDSGHKQRRFLAGRRDSGLKLGELGAKVIRWPTV